MRMAWASATVIALLAGTAIAQPQFEDRPVSEARDLRTELADEIARMKADIAMLERFMRRQVDLGRIARTDRAEALRQRLPMSDCLASTLAPLCDELTGLFRPEEGDEDAGTPPVEREGAP